MSGYSPSFSSEAEFVRFIKDMINKQPPRSFIIPTLSGDPSPEDPTNMWLLADGRLRTRHWNGLAFVIKEYTPVAPTATVPPPLPAVPATPITRSQTWEATWTQSYKGDGSARTDLGEQVLFYGSAGDANGLNRSLVGFDHASIASALAGSTVKAAQLTMTNLSTSLGIGANVYFGIHNSSSEPGTWPSIPRSKIFRSLFGSSETKTVNVPIEFATSIRDGAGKGIAIEAPDNNRANYGYAAGVGGGYTPPRLTVTYVK